jgi:chlorite dismutase
MDRLFAFTGGTHGDWDVCSLATLVGDGLELPQRLAVAPTALDDTGSPNGPVAWQLRGVMSNERYVAAEERAGLQRVQAGLGRAEATFASMIPIRKSQAWWALAQDERRAILEERSHHIAIGKRYLPAIARRLYHCRDLGQPFDFITWFEFAPENSGAFEDLLGHLRASEEWRYIDREVDVRLRKAA